MITETHERKIEVATALRAYQRVRSDGVQNGEEHEYEGLSVSTDFDGYTVALTDGVVTVRVLFHNQLAIDAPSGRALERFVNLIQRIAAGSSV